MVEMFESAGGTRQVGDAEQLQAAILELLEKPELAETMVAAATEVLAKHKGATGRTAAILLGK